MFRRSANRVTRRNLLTDATQSQSHSNALAGGASSFAEQFDIADPRGVVLEKGLLDDCQPPVHRLDGFAAEKIRIVDSNNLQAFGGLENKN